MKPEQQSCANRACPDFGKSSTDNIKVYGYKERRYYCLSCRKTLSESRASVFYHLHTHRQDFLEAIGMLAEPKGLRGIARVKGVKPDTVLQGLEIAGKEAVAVSNQLIHNLHLSQVQVDELGTFVKESPTPLARTRKQQAREIIRFGRR
jgi:transposase-like protein